LKEYGVVLSRREDIAVVETNGCLAAREIVDGRNDERTVTCLMKVRNSDGEGDVIVLF
jgi:hypothetical protein